MSLGISLAELESDPEALQVRDWRYKLQSRFLNSNQTLTPDEMPALDALFKVIEEYPNMTIGYLIFSKIGKVMRHIQLLDEKKVPRDDEFDFRLRAKLLLDQWHQLPTARREGDVVTERIGHMNLNGAA